jgi:DNA-binding phage protein
MADGILKRSSRCDPALAEKTGIHVKTLHQMFGPKGNPTAANLFNIIACLQEHEGVRLQVVA